LYGYCPLYIERGAPAAGGRLSRDGLELACMFYDQCVKSASGPNGARILPPMVPMVGQPFLESSSNVP